MFLGLWDSGLSWDSGYIRLLGEGSTGLHHKPNYLTVTTNEAA